MMAKGLSYLLGLLLLGTAETSWGQKAPNWRRLQSGQRVTQPGLQLCDRRPHTAKCWSPIPAYRSLTELDGSVKIAPAPSPPKNRVYESPAGQLWTVVPEGLLDFKNGAWSLHVVPGIVAESKAGSFRPHEPGATLPGAAGSGVVSAAGSAGGTGLRGPQPPSHNSAAPGPADPIGEF